MDQDQAPRWGASPEDEGDLLEDTKDKSKRPLFQRLIGENVAKSASQEESEDDSPEGTRKKRFRGLFKKLFPSIATKEGAGSSEQAEKRPMRGVFAEFMLRPPLEERAQDSQPSQDTAHEPEQLTLETEASETAATEDPLAYESLGSEPADADRVPGVENPTTVPAPETPRFPIDSRIPAIEQPHLVMDQLTTPPVLSRAEGDQALPPNIERLPGQKTGTGALVAFLAAEFLSRRRDRKIKKDIKTLKTKTKNLTNIIDTYNQIDTRSNNILKQKIEQDPASVSTTEEVLSREVTPSMAPPSTLEKSANIKTRTFEAVASTDNKEKAPPVENPELEDTILTAREQENRMDYFLKMREKQLEELRKVTEEQRAETKEVQPDKRRERDFDRRHEVLDESATIAPALSGKIHLSPAASIGDVLKERNSASQYSSNSNIQTKSSDKLPSTNDNTPSMYHQSAQYGVAAGLAIALFAIIAYILR